MLPFLLLAVFCYIVWSNVDWRVQKEILEVINESKKPIARYVKKIIKGYLKKKK